MIFKSNRLVGQIGPMRGQDRRSSTNQRPENSWFPARPDILGWALSLGRRLINLDSFDRGNIKMDPDRLASHSTNYLIDCIFGGIRSVGFSFFSNVET